MVTVRFGDNLIDHRVEMASQIKAQDCRVVTVVQHCVPWRYQPINLCDIGTNVILLYCDIFGGRIDLFLSPMDEFMLVFLNEIYLQVAI